MTCPRCRSEGVVPSERQGISVATCSTCGNTWSWTACEIGRTQPCGKAATHRCVECQRPMCDFHGSRGSRKPLCQRCTRKYRNLTRRPVRPGERWWVT